MKADIGLSGLAVIGENLISSQSIEQLCASLSRPRKVMMLVKAVPVKILIYLRLNSEGSAV